MRISSLARSVSGSETMAITARSAELRQQGLDVVSFAAGEPDFDTPQFIKDAAISAIQGGFTKYTAAAGILELRSSIARWIEESAKVKMSASRVVVTAGAKQALYLAFQSILEPGDEVLIPRPYWVSFPQQVLLCGGQPVFVETLPEEGFRVSLDRLDAAVTPRTRVLLLNSPNNPTGAVYARQDLIDLMEWAARRDLWVISDETYDTLTYGGVEHVSPASLSEDAASRTVITGSFSKSFAMTGWRVGYLAAPEEIASAAGRIASHTTSNVNSIAQKAAYAALAGPRDTLESMKKTFEARRDLMMERLRAMPGISCFEPQGAFYAFPDVRSFLNGGSAAGAKANSAALAAYLLEEALVAVVPGGAFGAEGYLRLSYTTSAPALERGLERMAGALKKIL